MRRTIGYCVVVLLGLALFVSPTISRNPLAAGSKIKLNAVSAWPKTAYMSENFLWFVERANKVAAEKFPGEFEIVFKGGPEVMAASEQVTALKDGFMEMVFTAASYYTSVIPAIDGMVMSNLKPWEERQKGVNDFLQKIHKERANAYYLSRMGSGFNFQLYVNKPVAKLDDFKGMSIRTSPTNIPILKKIGANPVVMPPGDLYTALERGVVDGYVWPEAHIRDWGWETVTKYMVVPPTPYDAVDILLVNLDKWNALPKPIQSMLNEVAAEAEHQCMERAAKFKQEEIARLEKMGIQIIKLPDAEAKKFLEISYNALWDTLMERDAATSKQLREMIR